jgi:riboflavin transporter FmnP
LGTIFVLPAGLIYNHKKTKKNAILGAVIGAISMAVISVFTNFFFVYPAYTKLMPINAIIDAYKAINPNVNGLLDALIKFNMPFTFIKGMLSTFVTILIYKRLSPILKKN